MADATQQTPPSLDEVRARIDANDGELLRLVVDGVDPRPHLVERRRGLRCGVGHALPPDPKVGDLGHHGRARNRRPGSVADVPEASEVANRVQHAFNGAWTGSAHGIVRRTCERSRVATPSLSLLSDAYFIVWDIDIASMHASCRVPRTSFFAHGERQSSSTGASGIATRGARKPIGQRPVRNSGTPNWTGILSVMG